MRFYKQLKFNDELISQMKSVLENHKIVHIVNVPKEIGDEFYINAGNSLGYLFRKDFDPIQKKLIDNSWTIIEYNEKYIHDTYKHSNKAQPLHTDYCNAKINLDLVIIICNSPADVGGATLFLDSAKLLYLLKKYNPTLLSKIENTEVIFGKNPSPIFQNKSVILSYDYNNEPVLFWNFAVVSPENSREVLAVAEEFHEFLNTYVEKAGILTEVSLKKGDMIIFHDKKLLHGRNAYFGYRKLLKGGIMTKNIDENLKHVKQYINV